MGGRGAGTRAGFFEPPVAPPTTDRLRIDPSWSAARLSGSIIRGVWPWIAAGSVLLIVHGIAGMLLPVVIGMLVDKVVAPSAAGVGFASVTGPLVWWGLALVGVYLVVNLSYRFGGRLGWFGVQRSQFELSQAVLSRVLDPRGMVGAARAPGGLLAVATGDVHRACLVLYVTVYPPGEIVGLLTAAVILFAIHPWLGLGVVVALPIVVVLMQLAAIPLRRRSIREQAGLADAAAVAADLVAGYRVIRGINAQATAAGRYRTVSREALRGTLAAQFARAGFDGISTATAQLFAAAVVVAAAILAFTGQLTIGQLVTVAGVAVSLIGPLDGLVGTLGTFWAISQASARRVLDLLSEPANPAGLGEHTGDTTQRVGTAEDLLRVDRLALPDGSLLNTTVSSGEFVVIDLPQAGQRLLTDVLSAQAVPVTGQVLLDGVAVEAWDPTTLRERVLAVPHTAGLFAGTVLENARATGDKPLDEAIARTALRVAALTETELPSGYDATRVGDGGRELSGGQRQRIALARAITADPDLLVLTDPTSSVDAVTEQHIAAALRTHRVGRTTIVLTSSPAFRAVADRLIAPYEGGEPS
ncbi:ABC transporter transmembrane domain-containing protein [Brachybacterium alimentarium]|uniref:ABC transporter ATP-binding protein n=1 Tax=Brevibacterium aurantiacum TaxID=273384 RepID=A0A2A3Z7Z0_BREAU|nr:ABC transporter ATP-binding protein [Brachybacterium alimentarium]PCC47607.1 ABC transporter ATP-binding protein [Brevibacterium aurantiacum]RCS83201.1 ABC transporter ATP-binding protein [Brachybacterium alimentarium]